MWIDDWQMQCCGDPFAVGSTMTWSTVPVTDTTGFAVFLDPAVAASITDHEERHPYNDHEVNELHEITGVVTSIDAAFCRYVTNNGISEPAAGSGICEPRSQVTNGWESRPGDEELSFVGYLVMVETADE